MTRAIVATLTRLRGNALARWAFIVLAAAVTFLCLDAPIAPFLYAEL